MQELNVFQARRGENWEWRQVNLLVSDRQLIISPNIMQDFGSSSLNYFCISYGWVEKCEVLPNKNKKESTRMRLILKDGR